MKRKMLLLAIVISFLILLLIGYFSCKNKMKKVEKEYIDIAEKIIDTKDEQENINVISKEEMELNKNVIGILEIPKIEIKAPVRDGTDYDVLNDSIGHFKNTSYWNGNVGLASHNNGNFVSHYFENLDKLVIGDTITYKTKFGERRYEIFEIKKIDSQDWSELSNTKENTITLITCVKNKPNIRLCVKAIEK